MFLYIESSKVERNLIAAAESGQEVRIMQDKALSRHVIGREVVAQGTQPHTGQVIVDGKSDTRDKA
jgi:hypothetical protein